MYKKYLLGQVDVKDRLRKHYSSNKLSLKATSLSAQSENLKCFVAYRALIIS